MKACCFHVIKMSGFFVECKVRVVLYWGVLLKIMSIFQQAVRGVEIRDIKAVMVFYSGVKKPLGCFFFFGLVLAAVKCRL